MMLLRRGKTTMVTAVTVKAYASPSGVLLAFDWKDGAGHPNFLGFAIQRSMCATIRSFLSGRATNG